MEPRVVALLCSDLHLSHRQPVCRSGESSWYEAQARPLKQLSALQERYDCPVVMAGDLFDRFNEPAELINFAIDMFPRNVWAIPGQHDLAHHGYSRIHKSAYWTLVKSGVISNLEPDQPNQISDEVACYGYPWGFDPEPIVPSKHGLTIAAIHAFVWKGRSTGHPGAPDDSKVQKWRERLQGYHVAVFGDNHIPFMSGRNPTIFNCGCFQRRTKAEIPTQPGVGLLYVDGSVATVPFNVSEDIFLNTNTLRSVESRSELSGLVDQLSSLTDDTSLDFASTVREILKESKCSSGVRSLVLRAIEE